MTILYSNYGVPDTPPEIYDGSPSGGLRLPDVTVSFSILDTGGDADSSSIELELKGPTTTYNAIVEGVFQSGYSGSISAVSDGFDVSLTTHPDLEPGSIIATANVSDLEGITDVSKWSWTSAAPPNITNMLPSGIMASYDDNVTFSTEDEDGDVDNSNMTLELFTPSGNRYPIFLSTFDVINGYNGTISKNALGGYDISLDTHPPFVTGYYQAIANVSDALGMSDEKKWSWRVAVPVSSTFDTFDFCHPTEAVMSRLMSFHEVETGGTVTTSGDDYTIKSGGSVSTAESYIKTFFAVPNGSYSLWLSLLPTSIPDNFSSLSTNRLFIGIYNNGGYMVGLLLSENGGIALTNDPTNVTYIIPSTSDIFDAGLDFYIFLIVVNETDGKGYLYITRKDIYNVTGAHELRHTFDLLSTPAGKKDQVVVSAQGVSGEPTEVDLDCIRLSSSALHLSSRPIAVIS